MTQWGIFFYFMSQLNPYFLAISSIHLRFIWLVFTILLVASFAGDVITFPKSFALQKSHFYVFIFKVLVLGLLIFATYKKTKPWWFFTIAVISLKIISLLKFYTAGSYYIHSVLYYEEYAGIFFRLKLPVLALLLFGNNLCSAVLLVSTYAYCLYLCELLVQASISHTNAPQPPAPAPSDSATP